MKIAMWSGPRNLSTAMMYSFGNRLDCTISDEPFYASYLNLTGLSHPMTKEILESQPADPFVVIDKITGPNPKNAPIWYQKHMTHHILPETPINWIADFKNVFLIRHPARVIESYSKKREQPNFSDLGFEQQLRIFKYSKKFSEDPIVLDSDIMLSDPKKILSKLCAVLEIQFDPNMLSWPSGRRSEDGVWAAHWYQSVHASTGFQRTIPKKIHAPKEFLDTYQKAMPIYEHLLKFAIT